MLKLRERGMLYNLVVFGIIGIYLGLNSTHLGERATGDEFVYGYVGSVLFNIPEDVFPTLHHQKPEVKAHYYPNLEHPPLAKLFVGLSWLLFDTGRVIPWLFGAASLYFVYRFVANLHTKLAGVLATVMVAFDPIFAVYSMMAVLDIFLFFFTILTLYYVTKLNLRGSSISLGLGMLVKLPSMFIIPAIVYYVKPHWKVAAIHLGIPFAIFTIITVPYNTYIYNIAEPEMVQFTPALNNPVVYWTWMMKFHTSSNFIYEDGSPVPTDPLAPIAWFVPYLLPGHQLFNYHYPFDMLGIMALPLFAYSIIRLRRITGVKFVMLLLLCTYVPFALFGLQRPIGESWFLPITTYIACLWGIAIADYLLKSRIGGRF